MVTRDAMTFILGFQEKLLTSAEVAHIAFAIARTLNLDRGRTLVVQLLVLLIILSEMLVLLVFHRSRS